MEAQELTYVLGEHMVNTMDTMGVSKLISGHWHDAFRQLVVDKTGKKDSAMDTVVALIQCLTMARHIVMVFGHE